MTSVREVSRKVKHPISGEEIKRVAKATHPVLFREKSEGDAGYVASFEEILNFCGSPEKVAELIQDAIDNKVSYLARLALGGAEENQKALNKAIKNLKVVFPQLSDDELRTMLMSMPGAKEKFEAVEIPAVIELSYGPAEILGVKPEAETSEE